MQNDMMMGPLAPGQAKNTRRIVLFIIVVAIHAILGYGFSLGITDIVKEKILANLQTVEIAAPEEEEVEPPPPPPKTEAPPPFVPPPDIAIELPAAESTTAIQVVTQTKPVEAPPPVAERRVVTVPPQINKKRPPVSSEEFYPQMSKRREEEGSVDVQLDVDAEGRVTDARVLTTSKFPLLDEAAVKYVKTWRLLPGTVDGKPVPMQASFRVTFKLTK